MKNIFKSFVLLAAFLLVGANCAWADGFTIPAGTYYVDLTSMNSNMGTNSVLEIFNAYDTGLSLKSDCAYNSGITQASQQKKHFTCSSGSWPDYIVLELASDITVDNTGNSFVQIYGSSSNAGKLNWVTYANAVYTTGSNSIKLTSSSATWQTLSPAPDCGGTTYTYKYTFNITPTNIGGSIKVNNVDYTNGQTLSTNTEVTSATVNDVTGYTHGEASIVTNGTSSTISATYAEQGSGSCINSSHITGKAGAK